MTDITQKLTTLKVVGIFPTEPYQRAKHYAQYLYSKIPYNYACPVFRPMLDVQWTEFVLKHRRNEGAQFWKLNSPVAVFINDVFFGDDDTFARYCSREYGFHIFENFIRAGQKELQNFICTSERNHVYFIISVDEIVIGTLLVELYNDLVPLTCDNFMRLVNRKSNGYSGAPINRVAKTAWIQIGGQRLKPELQPCENYFVHHDRRGVLSMCNNGKHNKNSTQFFIALQSSEWMDYTYVGFGQVLHGEDVLQTIENVETKYESPTSSIVIDECGEYTFIREPETDSYNTNQAYYEGKNRFYGRNLNISRSTNVEACSVYDIYPDDIYDVRDVDSTLSVDNYKKGLYSID